MILMSLAYNILYFYVITGIATVISLIILFITWHYEYALIHCDYIWFIYPNPDFSFILALTPPPLLSVKVISDSLDLAPNRMSVILF